MTHSDRRPQASALVAAGTVFMIAAGTLALASPVELVPNDQIAPVDHPLAVPSGTRTLNLTPAGWGDGLRLALAVSLGLGFSVFLGYRAKLLLATQTQRRRSAHLAACREVEPRPSTEDLERAQALAQVGCWVFHPQTGGLCWSLEARRILGLAGGAALNLRAFLRRVPRPDRHAVARAWRAAFTGVQEEVQFRLSENTHWCGDSGGAYRWVRVRTEARCDGNAPGGHRVGAVQDITARMEAQQALAASETRYRQIVEMANEGIWVIDMQGVTTFANVRMAEMLGCTHQDLVGRPFFDFMDGEGRRLAELNLAESAAGIAAQHEFRFVRADGTGLWTLLVTTPLWGADGQIRQALAMVTDITASKQAEAEIKRLALYDPLTGLANRRLLLDRLTRAQVAAARSGRLGALLFIDLDDFKTINDTHGHAAGDEVLRQVAERLTNSARKSDSVARLGGDEFTILLEDLSTQAEEAAVQARAVGDKVLAALNQPYRVAGQAHLCTTSIGIALFTPAGADPEELFKRADQAMYQAKAAGRNALRFFDPALQAAVTERAAMAADLREGLAAGQILLYYQPQVDGAGRLIGAEALVRWQHPCRGLLAPAQFIPLAEETGLILPLGRWVLETACYQLAVWARHPETAQLTLAVNISVRQFRHPDFVAQVLAALRAAGADPRRLRLELCERLLADPGPDTAAKVAALKARGLGLALGDLGTSISALAGLRRLPWDQVKIDRSFVWDLLSNPDDAAIARAILALAKSLGLTVIAEGVETRDQQAFLADLGCEGFQGFLFGRPGPVEDLDAAAEAAWV